MIGESDVGINGGEVVSFRIREDVAAGHRHARAWPALATSWLRPEAASQVQYSANLDNFPNRIASCIYRQRVYAGDIEDHNYTETMR
jgi:hypothetical protein